MFVSRRLKEVPLTPCSVIAIGDGGLSSEVLAAKATLHKTVNSSLEIWEYPPGEFALNVDSDQSACVVTGYGKISLTDGRQIDLLPGSAIFLPAGVTARWTVRERIRTVAACRRCSNS